MRNNLSAYKRGLHRFAGIVCFAALTPICGAEAQQASSSGNSQGSGYGAGSGRPGAGGNAGAQNGSGGQGWAGGGQGQTHYGNGVGNAGHQGGSGGEQRGGSGPGRQGEAGGYYGGGQHAVGGDAGYQRHFHGDGNMGHAVGDRHDAGYAGGNPRWWQGRREFAHYVGGRPGYYFAPGYGYHPVASAYLGRAWVIGAIVPPELRTYVVADPTIYGMTPAAPGYRWIYVADGLAMIDEHRGIIVRSAFHIW